MESGGMDLYAQRKSVISKMELETRGGMSL